MHPAYSVILFTTSSGAGYGLLFWLSLAHVIGAQPVAGWGFFAGLFIALGLITLGLLSSTFHLGRPERAWRALSLAAKAGARLHIARRAALRRAALARNEMAILVDTVAAHVADAFGDARAELRRATRAAAGLDDARAAHARRRAGEKLQNDRV